MLQGWSVFAGSVFLLSLVGARAAEKPPVQSVADVIFLSQYVAHGIDLSNGGPVVQGTVIAKQIFFSNLELRYIYSWTMWLNVSKK